MGWSARNMKDMGRMRRVLVAVALVALAVGCVPGAHSAAPPPSWASRPVLLAHATCWNTMSCCIQRFPTTAELSCGASATEIAEVLNGAAVLSDALPPGQVTLKEDARGETDSGGVEADEAKGGAAPEPPDCRGQNHHVISRPIAKELNKHTTLRGLYQPRDERFVAKAKDEESHCGYQQWHRDVDQEVIDWLRRAPTATRKEFENMLREIYGRPDMLRRFPNGF